MRSREKIRKDFNETLDEEKGNRWKTLILEILLDIRKLMEKEK